MLFMLVIKVKGYRIRVKIGAISLLILCYYAIDDVSWCYGFYAIKFLLLLTR